MYSTSSYRLTKEEYYYLLPAIGRNKLAYFGDKDKYALIVDFDDLEDILNRLKGLYGYFDELPSMTAYKCSKVSSLEYFRNFLTNL